MCCRRCRSRCRRRRTNAGVNDPGALPRRWPQSATTGSFTPALVVSRVAVASAQHVPDERAARVPVIVCEFGGRNQCVIRSQTGSPRVAIFPGKPFHSEGRFCARHHRAFDARAVLGVVNALRFASTRPTAGPAGIDDACARHVSGSYAMVVRVMASRMALTRQSRRSMLASSRQCRPAHPPFAPRANGARIRPAPTGHGIERISSLCRSRTCTLVSCEQRDPLRCIVLRTVR